MWQRLEDSRNALVVSCGVVQVGDRGTFERDAQGPYISVQLLSARRCTFEHCTSCCPSRDATMVVLRTKEKKKKKKKKNPNAAYHSTKKIFWRSVPTSEARCSLKAAVWRRDSESTNQQTNKTTTWLSGSRLSLKKLLRPAWPPCIGHDQSAVTSIIQRSAARTWISAIFPGGCHYFSPHKMAKKNHWISWHSRFNWQK